MIRVWNSAEFIGCLAPEKDTENNEYDWNQHLFI